MLCSLIHKRGFLCHFSRDFKNQKTCTILQLFNLRIVKKKIEKLFTVSLNVDFLFIFYKIDK